MLDWALFRLFTIAVLILANAFFVAAEFAVVSVRETRLEQMLAYNRAGAAAALRLKREIDDFLAANQLGVTLCSLALGWLGEQGLAELLQVVLERRHLLAHGQWLQAHAGPLSHGIATALAFTIITFLEVVLGEQVPKSLSLQKAERIALAIAGPMDVFIRLVRPAVRLLKLSTALVLRLFRVSLRPETTEVHSPEEIKLVASATRESGLLPEFQERLIHHAIDLDNVTVREIMTPRGRMFCLPSDMPVELASARIVEEQHSRIPVYDPALGVEHILGIVYSKDISRLMHLRRNQQLPSAYAGTGTLRSVMRDALLVPETKPTGELLQEFQERRRQIAIVVDEFGSTVGLVTAEDALEQIVGELDDEFDLQGRGLAASVEGRRSVEMDGTVPLRDLVTQLHWKIPRENGIETLAGFVLAQLGHLPEKGESFTFGLRRFTVLERVGRRVSRVRVETLANPLDQQFVRETHSA
ncbi:hemolysin family protein [Terriglobus sp.]|uniref:hemolysin family protein n=1 Tax=Terriglobus sp. TaxID=1889013 RepID=UPI003AFFEAD2